MTPEDEKRIVDLMRAARAKSRGYADFFGWETDRPLAEWGVTNTLRESLEANGEAPFTALKVRRSPNDPPDCEAIDANGKRIAIEVTELVDGRAIQAHKSGRVYDWAEWPRDKFLSALSERIAEKGKRYPLLKDGPYEGGYLVLIHTDEPMLRIGTVREYLKDHLFPRPQGVTRALLLLSYDGDTESYPYVDLPMSE